MTNAARDVDRGDLIRIGDLDLWVDVDGTGPTVVLLAGADTPGFRWHPTFVDGLLEVGFQVIRFDTRDCGRSSSLGPDAGYLLDDLAGDVIGILDHLEVDHAHLIGRSMGGMVGQVLALDHPARVRSLTLLGSTPGAGDDRLPGPSDDFVDKMMHRLFAGPPDDEVGRIEWLVELGDLMAGSAFPYDRDEAAFLARIELHTGWRPETGHGVAVHASPSRLDRLGEITQPTLVVHGTDDPVFPIEHGQALARGISGAALVEVGGLGHETPTPLLIGLLPMIAEHVLTSEHPPPS